MPETVRKLRPALHSEFIVKSVSWESRDADAARAIRMDVFVREQKVPAELELDQSDQTAYHVLAFDAAGEPCGTGRLFADAEHPECAHIGRMAVLPAARGSGCGRSLLRALIAEARRREFEKAVLSAQTHALAFYSREGFVPYGEQYVEAGIPHQDMELNLRT